MLLRPWQNKEENLQSYTNHLICNEINPLLLQEKGRGWGEDAAGFIRFQRNRHDEKKTMNPTPSGVES